MVPELIFKYLSNEASEDEVMLIFEWIEKSQENKNQFIAFKKLWAVSSLSKTSNADAWKSIQKQLSENTKKKHINIWKYAAVLFILIGLTKIITLFIKSENQLENKIVIELSNGTLNYITDDEEKNLLDTNGNIIGKQTANEIIYTTNIRATEIAYNTLKIPYGKTFKVILSDGTLVHLNAGTTFKYPEQFGLDETRSVYLNGEAFFEVTKNEQQPFIVHSNKVDVEVLGTKFNISSYLEDKSTHCELVEGSVRLSESENALNHILLSPNHKATWNQESKVFETSKVDINLYTSWTYGELIFKDAPFAFISKKLERSYDVRILNNNQNLNNQKFTGTIKIKESNIEAILELFKIDTPFEYSKEGNTIEISNTNLKA